MPHSIQAIGDLIDTQVSIGKLGSWLWLWRKLTGLLSRGFY